MIVTISLKTGWAVSQNGKSASQRGYGYLWRKIRERVIKRAKVYVKSVLD